MRRRSRSSLSMPTKESPDLANLRRDDDAAASATGGRYSSSWRSPVGRHSTTTSGRRRSILIHREGVSRGTDISLNRLFSPCSIYTLIYVLMVFSSYTTTTTNILQPVQASITLADPTYNHKSYESQPAIFGRAFEPGIRYHARLQRLATDPYLCGGTRDSDAFLEDDGIIFEDAATNADDTDDDEYDALDIGTLLVKASGGDVTTLDERTAESGAEADMFAAEDGGGLESSGLSQMLQYLNNLRASGHLGRRTKSKGQRQYASDKSHVGGGGGGNKPKEQIVVPADGAPVAVLAKRGQCNFETKARMAQKLLPSDHVKFLIVYDDVHSSNLSSMSARHPGGIHVGCLFVSLGSGLDLLTKLMTQSAEVTKAGGTELFLDGTAPWIPSIYDDPHGWVFVSLSGMILFVLSFGCLLMCFQTGYIRREGNVIIFGYPTEVEGGGRRRDREAPLLSRDQVFALPEVVYEGNRFGGHTCDSEEDGNCGGAGSGEMVPLTNGGGNRAGDVGKVIVPLMAASGQRSPVPGSGGNSNVNPIESKASSETDVSGESANSSTSTSQTSTQDGSNEASFSDKVSDNESDATELHRNGGCGGLLACASAAPSDPQLDYYENASCTVCLEDFVSGERLRLLPCRHTFHTECILPWLTERHSNCPLCKNDVMDEDEFSDSDSDEDSDDEDSMGSNSEEEDEVDDGEDDVADNGEYVNVDVASERGSVVMEELEGEPLPSRVGWADWFRGRRWNNTHEHDDMDESFRSPLLQDGEMERSGERHPLAPGVMT